MRDKNLAFVAVVIFILCFFILFLFSQCTPVVNTKTIGIEWDHTNTWGKIDGKPILNGLYELRLVSKSDTIPIGFIDADSLDFNIQELFYSLEIRRYNNYQYSPWVSSDSSDVPFKISRYILEWKKDEK